MPRNMTQACRHFGLSRKTYPYSAFGQRTTMQSRPDYAPIQMAPSSIRYGEPAPMREEDAGNEVSARLRERNGSASHQ